MITRFYYSIYDLLDVGSNEIAWNQFLKKFDCEIVNQTQTEINCYGDVWDNYQYDYIVFIDIEHPLWEVVAKPNLQELYDNYYAEVKYFLGKIRNYVIEGDYKYGKLIQLYDNEKNNLMKQVEGESSVQFNDTPQTTNTGLDDDKFASTYTKNKSKTDAGTVIARLNEINTGWKSIYDQWSREFGRKFVIYND